MKNMDKYRDIVDNSLSFSNALCRICNFTIGCPEDRGVKTNCKSCAEETFAWLFQEYEPPLLRNGDDLNPGDWVMVRLADDKAWCKFRFVCFYRGLFYVIDELSGNRDFRESGTNITGWYQARLPEEGE